MASPAWRRRAAGAARTSRAPSATPDALALITARASADAYGWSITVAALPSGLGVHRLTDALLVITGMLAVLGATAQDLHPTSLLMRLHSAYGRSRAARIDRLAVAITNTWLATGGESPPAALTRSRRRTAALNMALIDLAARLADFSDRASGVARSRSLRVVALRLQHEGEDDDYPPY